MTLSKVMTIITFIQSFNNTHSNNTKTIVFQFLESRGGPLKGRVRDVKEMESVFVITGRLQDFKSAKNETGAGMCVQSLSVK